MYRNGETISEDVAMREQRSVDYSITGGGENVCVKLKTSINDFGGEGKFE